MSALIHPAWCTWDDEDTHKGEQWTVVAADGRRIIVWPEQRWREEEEIDDPPAVWVLDLSGRDGEAVDSIELDDDRLDQLVTALGRPRLT